MGEDLSEPDKVYYSSSLSRRDALALGGTGLASALAGCGGILDPDTGEPSNPPPESGDGTDGDDEEDEAPYGFRIVDIGPEESKFEIRTSDDLTKQIQNGETVEYTLRLYSTPIYESSRTLLKETTIQLTKLTSTHTVSYEFDEELLNYAQQPIFSLEKIGSDDSEEIEYTPETVLLPYYNQAADEIVVDVPGTKQVPLDVYSNELEPMAKTRVWFSQPEDHFNKPEPGEEIYPTQWYGDYTDLIITMVVRYPVYDEMTEQNGNTVPQFDWAVFNFDIADVEMIEARRWNSWLIQQAERGLYELSEDGRTITSPGGTEYDRHDDRGSLLTSGTFYSGDANQTPTPFSEYYRSRYGDATTSPDNANITPIQFAGGRPVLKRWAVEMNNKLSNNPNFQQHPNQEYYKATTLKAIIGSSPYEFGYGSYMNAPEEVISNWYQNQGQDEALGGNCVSASTLFAGIGVHLLNSSVGIVHMTGENLDHLQSALIGLSVPDSLPDSANNRMVIDPIESDDRRYDSQYGRFIPVECNYPGAVIGYNQRVEAGEYSLTLRTFASQMDINSHIPVNDDYEPDIDGEILADREPAQNAFEFYRTIVQPSPFPSFED